MFITIQNKCKVTPEHFAMCTYSTHKIKTNTLHSFNVKLKLKEFWHWLQQTTQQQPEHYSKTFPWNVTVGFVALAVGCRLFVTITFKLNFSLNVCFQNQKANQNIGKILTLIHIFSPHGFVSHVSFQVSYICIYLSIYLSIQIYAAKMTQSLPSFQKNCGMQNTVFETLLFFTPIQKKAKKKKKRQLRIMNLVIEYGCTVFYFILVY